MKKVKDQKYLYIRNGVYYFRVTIPKRYREYFGKSELKESLETSNLRDAVIKVCEKTANYASTIKSIDEEQSHPRSSKQKKTHVSNVELERIVRKWFYEHIEMEDIRLRARNGKLNEIREGEEFKKELLEDAFINSEPIGLYNTWLLEDLIEKNNLDLEESSDKKKYLEDLVVRAHLELAKRRIDELHAKPGTSHDAELFSRDKYIQEKSNPTNSSITIKQLLKEYENDAQHQNWSPKTVVGYRSIHNLIIEFFGPRKEATSIGRDDCRRFRDMVMQYPKNATKIYPNLTYQKRIDRGRKEGRELLAAYTQNQYITRLSSILEWAVREEYLVKNSASRLTIIDDVPDDEKRDSFDTSDLKKMFSSTIYTGRKPGNHGAYKAGPLVIKDARYWLPLIALFQGARLNEMAQLKTSGIVKTEGIDCILFFKQSKEQRLKNKHSKREIPIHPELKRLGFLTYVETIKASGEERLFPELELDGFGYYSGHLSKKFNYWLRKIGVKSSINCFHSFRHTFEDALRDADVAVEIQEKLGGWAASSGNKSSRKSYGRGYLVKKLNENIKRVKYPGLDLSHLYES